MLEAQMYQDSHHRRQARSLKTEKLARKANERYEQITLTVE